MLGKVFKSLFRKVSVPAEQRRTLTIEEYERLQPVIKLSEGDFEASYVVPTSVVEWRVNTLRTKEPDTIEWIKEFQPDEVLVDVGANIGIYTIWAAVTRQVKVYAFEPESQNFAILNRNIFQNDLSGRVIAYCAALSDEQKFDVFYLRKFAAAYSGHSFGEEVSYDMLPMQAKFLQGSVATTLDQLVADGIVQQPDHIKIDVDGFEHKVVQGARKTIENDRLKSILVETNHHLIEHRRIVEYMDSLGFKSSYRQVVAGPTDDELTSKGAGNYIFRRS
jgi:FkbM family methyltransferase